jgi:serine-type D-Ala-D-Ala carboxypeptidase
MRLYDMGLLNLDDPWVKWVPEGNNNGKDKISIRNLLLHNAGFAPDYPFNDNYEITRETFMTWMFNTTLDYPVGQKYVYSDVSMTALQLVIERISGQSLSEFTQE